jgi:hypothetical protein
MVVDGANVALQEGMGLQSERDVRIGETPSAVFFCVRPVILLPFAVRTRTTLYCLQAGLSMIRPTETHI